MKKIFIIVLTIAFMLSLNVKVKALSISKTTFIPTLIEVEGTEANGNTTVNEGTGSGVGCEEIGGEFTTWLNGALKLVQYIGTGLAIVLTAVDFIQVVGGSKDDDLKKAFDRAIKRLVAVILLLLTSVLVSFIVGTFIDPVVDTDVPNCITSS